LPWFQLTALVATVVVLSWSCQDETGPASQTSTGQGMGGCHSGPPAPLYTVKIHALGGTLPADTALTVKWSAGEEPTFALDDQSTWLTLEDGSNMECDVDPTLPIPTDLAELSCELWINGSVEVAVSASGYAPHVETVLPMEIEGCDQPVPRVVEVELMIAVDAGM
jgi:hypothetical protein